MSSKILDFGFLSSKNLDFKDVAYKMLAFLSSKILDFGGFDSNILLTPRGGIIMSEGIFPE